MDYKEMDLKTFFKQLGVHESILNNNSFNNIISDLGLSNWIELREKIETNIKKDNNNNNIISIKTNGYGASDTNISITPTGSITVLNSLYTKPSDDKNVITNYYKQVIPNENNNEIVTRNYSVANLVDELGNIKESLASSQTEKNYSIKTGLQTLESEVRGINIIPGVSNMAMVNRPDVVINESRIVRRTEIPNIVSAHCVKIDENNNKQEANGYVELDNRNILRMKNIFGQNIDFNSLKDLAQQNITVRGNLNDSTKENIINNAPKEIQEFLKNGLNKKIPLDYLESIKVDDSLNYNHHM